MNGLVPVAPQIPHLVHMGGHVVKALGAQEKTILGPGKALDESKVSMQTRDVIRGAELHVFRAAFWAKAHAHGDRLDQRGLATAIFPHKKRHIRMNSRISRAHTPGMENGYSWTLPIVSRLSSIRRR